MRGGSKPRTQLKLTEAGKAHLIKSLNLDFKDAQVSDKDLPRFKARVFKSWFGRAETKLNETKHVDIELALGRIYFTNKMIERVPLCP